MVQAAFSAVADSNSVRYWAMLFVLHQFLQFVVPGFSQWLVLLQVLSTVVFHVIFNFFLDGLNYFYGVAYYDPETIIQRGYSVSALLNDTLHSVGLDYGFNFYDGDYKKDRQQAQIDKFEYAIRQIGIKKGDRIIDIGCGCGDWLYYLQSKHECEVVGVNITEQQVLECRKRGLKEVYNLNWKDIEKDEQLCKKLYGRFDAVTYWDTVEHYVPSKYHNAREKQDQIYRDMFALSKKLLSPDTKVCKVWISCLHMARRVFDAGSFLPDSITTVSKMWYCYILDRFHSGFYPSYYKDPRLNNQHRDQLVDNAKKEGLTCTWRKDTTYDYYMTSVLEPTHFGRHKFEVTPLRILYMMSWLLNDPHWIHRLIWFASEDWMYQFNPDDISKSDVIMWWLVFELDENLPRK